MGRAVGNKQPDLIAPWRGIALILATLALSLKIMIPAGFMTSAASPFQLVLCSSQGIVAVDGDQIPLDHQDPIQASHDKPCAFSGHGAAFAPPVLLELTSAAFEGYAAARPEPHVSVAPGRGLAAPPPPSRGPPSLLI